MRLGGVAAQGILQLRASGPPVDDINPRVPFKGIQKGTFKGFL